MLIDAREIAAGTQLEGDVCIIGGGVAGILLATALEKQALRIVVLESGGIEHDDKTQELYAGKAKGVEAGYLTASRLRFFGGTSNHWGGFCTLFEEEDLQPTRGLERSGWPIDPAGLKDYYSKAAPFFGLSERQLRAETYQPDMARRYSTEHLRLVAGQIRPVRFGPDYLERFRKSERIQLVLNANVANIQAAQDGASITHVDVKTLSGVTTKVKCRYFVLACGGLENPRLLLLSDGVQKAGLGNQHDQVGRYFSDHMYFMVGRALLDQEMMKHGAFFSDIEEGKERYRYYFAFSKALRDREGLRNHCFGFDNVSPPKDVPPEWPFAKWLAFAQGRSEAHYSSGALAVMLDQTPNPESRVTLYGEKDALGLRRIQLDWRFSSGDRENLQKSLKLLAGEWGAAARSRVVVLDDWQKADWPYAKAWNNSNPSGTTRMSADPKQGVVDPDCKVHGIANLFVAGSSVFPETGWQTPTLTIAALALRMGDHLSGLLAS